MKKNKISAITCSFCARSVLVNESAYWKPINDNQRSLILVILTIGLQSYILTA